jgi:hypothetical protein
MINRMRQERLNMLSLMNVENEALRVVDTKLIFNLFIYLLTSTKLKI